MKKICFVTTVPGTLRSFVLKTAEYLHLHTDWDISFICTDNEEFAKSLPEYIHYFPVHMERGIRPAGIKAMWSIRKIFMRERFDLIQYSTPNASLYAALAGWMARIPVRLYCQWGIVYVGFGGIKRTFFKWVEKLVCRLSTEVEPDSYGNLRFAHAEKLYPENKGSVIWNGSACGINLEKFDVSQKAEYRKAVRARYGLSEDTVVFSFVGRLARDKGINELLEAFRQLSTDHSQACLMVIGANESGSPIREELLNWSLSSQQVIYTGRINVVEQYLAATDVYVLPSYREGFGMGTIEAEAMGVPVIVTDIPGPTDAMKDGVTGIVVPKKDVSSLKEAMQALLRDPERRASYGKEAVSFARDNFSQAVFFEQYVKKRKSLLDRGPVKQKKAR